MAVTLQASLPSAEYNEISTKPRAAGASDLVATEKRSGWAKSLKGARAPRISTAQYDLSSPTFIPIRSHDDAVFAAHQQRVRAVTGAVLAIEDATIVCEVMSEGRAVQINLLPDLFPEKPYFGMPFELSMVNQDGFMKPSVRKIRAEPTGRFVQELDELVRGF